MGMVCKYATHGSKSTDPSPRHGSGWRVRFGTFVDDARIAARLLLKKPGFTLAAVVTLGLGIGANTTIFSLVYWVLLKPLPYPNAEQLVSVYRIDPDVTGRNPSPSRLAGLYAVPYEVYGDWAEMSSSFEGSGAYFTTSFTLTGGDRPERLRGAMATSGVFASLGIAPALGRTFHERDDEVGAPGLALLSHGLWQGRYGSDPTVLGEQIVLSGISYHVVGVMPPHFGFPNQSVQVWVTFEDERKTSPVRSGGYLQVIARLSAGVSLRRAQLDVDAVALRIGELHPEESEHGIGLFPRKSLEVAEVRGGLVLLLGAVALVLLIACANIANLLLSRATERRRELGVRMALGAGRGRLLVQFLTESALLSLVGGVVGCVLAILSLGPFKAAFPGGLPRADIITVDYRMLLFAAVLSVLTGLLTGVLPALRAIRTPIANVLRDGSRGATGGRERNRTQAALVMAEIALAFVLLVGAGLFIRSLARLTSVEYGFDAENLLTVGVALPARYRGSDEASLGFFDEFSERLRAIPGVSSVGGSNQMPFVGGWSTPPAVIETSEGFVETVVHETTMDPGYFSTMGMPIVAGRGFTSEDTQGSMLVTVVNEAMVNRYWPNENPLGRRIGGVDAVGDSVWLTVVGVVGDVRYRLNMDPFPSYHIPLAQWPHWYQWIILRTAIDATVITPAVQETLAAIDPEVPIRVLQLEERIDNSTAVASPRFRIFVLSCLSGLAALLAFVGIYGVLAYTVQQRAHEIGIRLALGAGAKTVLRNFLARGLLMTGIGLGAGIALSFAASRVMSSLLFETSPTDPVTLILVSVLIAMAALGASYFPARRATNVDPVEVLRQE
jgi:putative ABC transport system permease protein